MESIGREGWCREGCGSRLKDRNLADSQSSIPKRKCECSGSWRWRIMADLRGSWISESGETGDGERERTKRRGRRY